MAYSTLDDDILKQLDANVLIQLTDAAGEAIDEDDVTRAIADADATIDSYCQDRYPVPFSPVPDKIRQVSVDIAIYNLYSLRDDTAPDMRKDRHKEAIRWLEKVNKGDITLGAATPSRSNTPDTVNISSNDRIFDRNKMSGF